MGGGRGEGEGNRSLEGCRGEAWTVGAGRRCTLSYVTLRARFKCDAVVARAKQRAVVDRRLSPSTHHTASIQLDHSTVREQRPSHSQANDSSGNKRRTRPPFHRPQPVPPAMDLVRALGETSAAGLQAWANVLGVRSTNGIAREEGAGGGTGVRLTVAEVQELRRALLDASETLLDAPISRRDFAALLSTVLTPSVPGLGPSFALDPPPPPAPALPAEIISIIVKQVRALYEAEKDDLRSMSSEHRGWKGLRRLQRVSKRWRSYVLPLLCYRELVLMEQRALQGGEQDVLGGTAPLGPRLVFLHCEALDWYQG